MAIVLDSNECVALAECPEALRALANWHECQATMIESMNDPNENLIDIHTPRARKLKEEADRIEAEY